MAEFSDYQWLVESRVAARLLAELAQDARPALTLLETLRRDLSAERGRLIVEQLDLRRRATVKFGPAAAAMFFTPVHLEQATDLMLARYKAARFTALGANGDVQDYCCGVGGDAAAIAMHLPCTGHDLSPVACLMAEVNVLQLGGQQARFETRVADVTATLPRQDQPWHVDPDRRATGRRSTSLELYSPGPELIDRWRTASRHGAVKLAPAAAPPADWQQAAELEWITSDRECRQLVVWFGRLAHTPGERRATTLAANSSKADEGVHGASFAAQPAQPKETAADPGRFIFDPDPALVAAGLVGALANARQLATLGPGSVYLTGENPVHEPLLQAFEVEDCLPLRPKELAKYLAARHVGQLEIKKRGVSTTPEQFRRQLKLRGDSSATVLLTRIGKRQVAIVARRHGSVA